jgi:hypothetical protein
MLELPSRFKTFSRKPDVNELLTKLEVQSATVEEKNTQYTDIITCLQLSLIRPLFSLSVLGVKEKSWSVLNKREK